MWVRENAQGSAGLPDPDPHRQAPRPLSAGLADSLLDELVSLRHTEG